MSPYWLLVILATFGQNVVGQMPSSQPWSPWAMPGPSGLTSNANPGMNNAMQSSMSNFMKNFGNPWSMLNGGSPMNQPSGPMFQGQPANGNPAMNRPVNTAGVPQRTPSQSGAQMNRPVDSSQMHRPTGSAQSQNPASDLSGPARNTAFWQNWFQNRGKEQNFVFNADLVNQNNSAGYETDEYCIYDLRMSYIYGAPDGVQKRIIGFNGQFPGPTLRCTNGKTMIVRVTNDIQDDDEPTSIHWHGIQQNLSPFYDGPQAITQCPVIRSNSMIYKFPVFQSGTYWYHSHHSYQYVDGAWGFLIIKNTPQECWANSYDDERLISVNDWTHRPARDISEVYLTQGNFPDVNSSLINGRGTFNCSSIEKGQVCSSTKQGPAVINVIQGKRYRFRILNSSAGRTYNVSIDGHKMVVIETDGVDTVKSRKVDVIPVLPAQRYSVIVIMDQPVGQYWIRISGEPATGTAAGLLGRAILRYTANPDIQTRSGQMSFSEPPQPGTGVGQGRPDYHDIPWDDIINSGGVQVPSREELQKYFPNQPPKLNVQLQNQLDAEHVQVANETPRPNSRPVEPTRAVLLDQMTCRPLQFGADGKAPTRYDRIITVNMTDCPLPGQPSRMCMNGEPFVPPSINSPPVLYQLITGERVRSSARPIYTPNRNEVVWLVVNNRHAFPHPWHLHGHTFWVMGAGVNGSGDFVMSRDISKLTAEGVRRDTTFTLGKSWAVIAYKTDNPGAWFFHCHINWHLEAGLGLTFIEGGSIAKRVYKFPPKESTQTCARVGVTI